jgi:hypothetical protein
MLLITRSGAQLELPPLGKANADAAAQAIREFLAIKSAKPVISS